MTMTPHDEHFLDRTPLGTTFPCGCTVRATFMSCDRCGYGQWGASATDVEPGGQVLLKGTCPVCGARIDGMAVVHVAPPSSSFSRT